MKLTRAVPAGLVDVGCASLATFTVGLYATLELTPAGLGTYGLFFTAFLTAAVVPTHLLLTPAEIAALDGTPAQRLAILGGTFRRGLVFATGAGVLGAVMAVGAARPGPDAVLWPLSLAMVFTSVVSPLQDHVRRCLHIGLRSWAAAATSVVQLVSVVVALAALSRLPVGAWVPFAALGAANVVSLASGVALARRRAAPGLAVVPTGKLLESGRWLLPLSLFPALALFASGVSVTWLAGADVFGYVEAARVLAQPIFVLGMGLMAVLTPPLMEAGASGHVTRARRLQRSFEGTIAVTSLGYLAVVGIAWPLNPLPELIPPAYAVTGLLALTIVSHGALVLMQPYRGELLGARRERELIVPEGVSSSLQCVVSLAAAVVGAYARPAGVLVQGVATWLWLRRIRTRGAAPGRMGPSAPESSGPSTATST